MENNHNQQTVTTIALGALPPESGFNRESSLLDGRLDLIKDVNVKLDVRLGGCELSIADLSKLKEGDVLTLDKAPDELIEVTLGGEVIARGRLVVAGEYFGIRIEQIAELTA